jgi:hypothetical protein
MSRPASQTSTATTTLTNVTRSLSVKTATKTGRNNPLLPSDIKLFVTNLRLLDLDLRSDWPAITVQTFSGRNADQKQRIGATEWSLFRLFEIWDPVETNQVRTHPGRKARNSLTITSEAAAVLPATRTTSIA